MTYSIADNVDEECPECGNELLPFINCIPSTGDDVGYRCPVCASSWTWNEWQEMSE